MGADYSSFGLQDKVAIVTGASQGIGRAIALGLATAGAHVVLAKHPEGRHDEIKGVQAEIEALGRKAPIIMVDVANVAQVRSLMEQTKEQFGRIDILVNNAGWTGTGPALDVTEEEYDRTMAASVKSVFFACQAAAKIMIPQGRGKIINIGSNFGVIAFSGRAVYAGSESGSAPSFTRALAGMGEVRRSRQCRRAVHHRNGLAQSHTRASRLQRVGHLDDAAGRTVESAGGSRGRGPVSLESPLGYGRRTCPDG